MVISTITSGLGNQLFQYAFARRKAIEKNSLLYFDLRFYQSAYSKKSSRSFKLDKFNIQYKHISKPIEYLIKFSKLLPQQSLRPILATVKEHFYHYDSTAAEEKALIVNLRGYWHSEKYFIKVQNIIRTELTFNVPHNSTFEDFKKRINASPNSVSIHIRRGDYVHHPEFSKTFGFIGIEYYKRAIQFILMKYRDSDFYVFTDDPEWVNNNFLNYINFTLVVNTGHDADINDLHLMSLCSHNIIANSSFSWWGGWLNNNPNKLVIAPESWFKNQPTWDTKDLLPESWIRLKSFES